SSVGAGITYDEYFLGYTYGADAVVADLKAGWTTADLRLSVEGNFFFMAHGTHDQWTAWRYIGGDADYQYDKASPTTKHTTYNAKYPDAQATRDSVEYTTVVGVNASYKVSSWLTAMVQVDYVNIRNYGNVSANAPQSDVQVVLGAQFTF
ncbi:MAG: hypothetical protein J5775_04015, partial [Spirochaetales bacterium]|nr:hypothetical protein [Spirochaetales bacterium]